jgi:hypothetical protein
MSEPSEPITHGGVNYGYKKCKCGECGVVDTCTPSRDFYTKDGEPNGLLYCWNCLTKDCKNAKTEPSCLGTFLDFVKLNFGQQMCEKVNAAVPPGTDPNWGELQKILRQIQQKEREPEVAAAKRTGELRLGSNEPSPTKNNKPRKRKKK